MQACEAVERNLAALKRIVAALVAMVACRASLPRRMHRAATALLLPAEAAARRLIIAASAGLSVSLPAHRPAMPHVSRRRRGGTMRPAALPLLDPLRRTQCRRRTCPPHAAPRIIYLWDARPADLPPPPGPGDPIDTGRLVLRLAALDAALEDLPGQARRFARWRALREAAHKRHVEAAAWHAANPASLKTVRRRRFRSRFAGAPPSALADPPPLPRPGFMRIFPLRGGRPPGGRLGTYDPDATPRAGIREIDEILAHAHSLAMHVLA